jgi:hypothetical protein
MKLFRSTVAALALLLSGCASQEGWRSENIPYPRSTPYDANEFSRTAYLDGFGRGYHAESSGGGGDVEMLSGPHSDARRRGFYAGMAQARADKAGTKR